MNAKDWILVTLASAEDTPLKPVQLQKALFVIGKKIPASVLGEDFFKFVPYDYGPFCPNIYSETENLEALGLVHISRPPIVRYKEFLITELGRQLAAEKFEQLPENLKAFICQLVPLFAKSSFNQLVEAIYRNYPETKVNSVYKDRSL